ncbi:MAG: 50S ribosomal protein L24 [Patescibacteria group bacterium]
MHIKKGDSVIVISGASKGAKGTVMRAIPTEGRIVIDGVNMRKKHQKNPRGGKGKVVEKPMPIDVSNVKLAK